MTPLVPAHASKEGTVLHLALSSHEPYGAWPGFLLEMVARVPAFAGRNKAAHAAGASGRRVSGCPILGADRRACADGLISNLGLDPRPQKQVRSGHLTDTD